MRPRTSYEMMSSQRASIDGAYNNDRRMSAKQRPHTDIARTSVSKLYDIRDVATMSLCASRSGPALAAIRPKTSYSLPNRLRPGGLTRQNNIESREDVLIQLWCPHKHSPSRSTPLFNGTTFVGRLSSHLQERHENTSSHQILKREKCQRKYMSAVKRVNCWITNSQKDSIEGLNKRQNRSDTRQTAENPEGEESKPASERKESKPAIDTTSRKSEEQIKSSKQSRPNKGAQKAAEWAAVRKQFDFSLGWKPMLKEKWYHQKEQIIGITLNNSKTGEMGKFVRGGRQCAQAASVAFLAARAAHAADHVATEAYVFAHTKMVVESASLKLHLVLYRVRRKLHEALLRAIQAKVEIQLAQQAGKSMIEIDLVNRVINLLKQVEFEPGGAVIKDVSMALVKQVTTALQAVATACQEFPECPPMHFRVEGHTAPSKRSKDHGAATSMARSRALVDALCATDGEGVGCQAENLRHTLWPAGFGDSVPPKKHGMDPRRVEVHLMTTKETTLAKWMTTPAAKKTHCAFSGTGKKMTSMFNKWKKGALGKVNDFENKVEQAHENHRENIRQSTFKMASRARKDLIHSNYRKEHVGEKKVRPKRSRR